MKLELAVTKEKRNNDNIILKFLNKQNIISMLISIYFSFASSFFLNIDKFNYSIIIQIGLAIILFPIFKYILNKTYFFQIVTNIEDKPKVKEFFIYFVIAMVFFVVYFLALYPGTSSSDTVSQWEQAINNSYNDWHPVMHTFLFYKIPSLIIKDYSFAIIWQLVVISTIIAFTCYEFRKLGFSKKAILIILMLIIINPYTARIISVVWKDVAYSFIMLLSTIFMIFIMDSNGSWLNRKRNILKLSLVFFLMLTLRHNGIISIAIIFGCLFLFYYKYWKQLLIMMISVLGIFYIITNPIYYLCNIEKHSSTFSEAMGIPLNQISYIYNNNGNITKKNEEYLSKIAKLDEWEKNFDKKNFNVIKWIPDAVNVKYIDENPKEFIENYCILVKNNLVLAIKSYYNVTSSIWAIEDATTEIGTTAENFRYKYKDGKLYKLSDVCNYIFNNYDDWTKSIGISKILFSYGGGLFLVFLSICIISNKCKLYIKKYIPYIPVLSNTLGIMLLITGGEHRFVYSQIICSIPLLFFGLSDIPKKEEENKDYSLLYFLFIEKTENTLLQFFRYIFVGGIAAVVNIGMLYLLTDFLKMFYIISNILAFVCGLTVNYILSKIFVFSKEKVESKSKEFITYTIIGIIGLGIDTLFMFVFTSLFGIFYLISKILSTAITFIWNFVGRKIMYKKEVKKYESK